MITESFIYWFTRLDHIHSILDTLAFFFICISFVAFFSTIASLIGKTVSHDADDVTSCSYLFNIVWKVLLASSLCWILTSTAIALTPTTKEMAAIYVLPKIAKNENVQEIGTEFVTLTKEWLNELHPSEVLDANKNKTKGDK